MTRKQRNLNHYGLHRALCAGVAAILVSTTPAQADLGDQLAKLLPSDGAEADQFGISIAISGDTAIVGAYTDDDNGSASGSAYLFNLTTGKGQQTFKLLANDGAGFDNFGFSVAISGTTALVGAKNDDDNGVDSGSAYLFDTIAGTQIAKLLADDGATLDFFGRSVGISPDGNGIAIVGAYRGDDACPGDPDCDSGAAYLFDVSDPRNPTQLFKLLPTDGAAGDRFGWLVATSDTTAIVGAPRDDDNGIDSGAAYLFDTTTGLQIAKLLPDDGLAEDWFGWSVDISGSIAVVGAIKDDDACPGDPNCDSGSAYLFDITTGQQLFKLLPDDGAFRDVFGNKVAIRGNTVIVGANGDDDNGSTSGSAYLFDISDPKNPIQIAKLLADDGAAGDEFGKSVDISSSIAIVGAFKDDDNGFQSGSAYLFDAAAPGTCAWDLDGSGDVGVKDLLFLLGAWGACPAKGDCSADFDNTGDVGVKDLLVLLGAWGQCP